MTKPEAICPEKPEQEGAVCQTCGRAKELRPYGFKGALVCFDCAMATPESKAEAERQFASQFEAAGPVVVIDGSEAGPMPVEHSVLARAVGRGKRRTN